MTKAPDREGDALLDDFFAAARAEPPRVPADLMARVLADAQARHAQRGPGAWALLRDLFGGRAGVAGLGAAAAFGVVLGVMQPLDLGLDAANFDLMPDTESVLALLESEI